MAGFREKITPFTFGLSVGLLAACLFFIFKLDDYLKKIDFSKLSGRSAVTEELQQPIKQIKTEASPETKKHKGTGKKENVTEPSEAPTHANTLQYMNDTVSGADESYRVLKEELQSVKNIYVKKTGPLEKANQKDSIIASLAGVEIPDNKEFFMIEFWKSPLNSKGYKMTRNRILIYGFTESSDLQLIKEGEKYYLRNNQVVYSISYSSDFRPLEKAPEQEFAGKFK